MTIREIISTSLITEGIAENAAHFCFDTEGLETYLAKIKASLNNKANLKEFYTQYKDLDTFISRAFGMYNQKLKNGYIVDNSNKNFENTIKPILVKFYNSL